jgi:hypothetical protein
LSQIFYHIHLSSFEFFQLTKGKVMTNKRVNEQQKEEFMKHRRAGYSQETAATKAGFSKRSASRIEAEKTSACQSLDSEKTLSTIQQPHIFTKVWESDILPLLVEESNIQAKTILRKLQECFPGEYSDSCLRTLQRHVKDWRGLNGSSKAIMFRQAPPPGWQGISDFTDCKELNITIQGESFPHILYHFRLAFSLWEDGLVITGGESFPALAEGLQKALLNLGGIPETHRTDSLSAAFKNLSEKDDFTRAYKEFCDHFSLKATRNNLGCSNENGCIEASNRHLKSSLEQGLILRGSRDFISREAYREFVDKVISRRNDGKKNKIEHEKKFLKPLPSEKARDFDIEMPKVTRFSTISVRQVHYTVPSRLIGSILCVHLYDDRLICFLANTRVAELKRIRWNKGKRPAQVDYRHLIEGLSKKPQAFRHYVYREAMMPTPVFRETWEFLDANLDDRSACKEYVAILKEAARDGHEARVEEYLRLSLKNGTTPKSEEVRSLFMQPRQNAVEVHVTAADPRQYDQLLEHRSHSNTIQSTGNRFACSTNGNAMLGPWNGPIADQIMEEEDLKIITLGYL